jgi:hypothetical protein
MNRISSLASLNSNTYLKKSENKQNDINNIANSGKRLDVNKFSTSNNISQMQAHSNNMHSQLIANSNVMQIFVKPAASKIPNSTFQSNSYSLLKSESKLDVSNNNENSVSSQQSVLEAREAHILKLNRQNVKIQEDNDNLLSEIEKVKYDSQDRLKSMERLLNETNAKYEQINSDREQLKKSNYDIQREYNELQNLFKEKESQIDQLTQEGLKLSKQELNQSNIIKKLRAKEKESEELLVTQKTEIQKTQRELDELKKILDLKEENETKNIEMLKKLEKAALSLEKELTTTKCNLEDSQEKIKGLENTLQNTFKYVIKILLFFFIEI